MHLSQQTLRLSARAPRVAQSTNPVKSWIEVWRRALACSCSRNTCSSRCVAASNSAGAVDMAKVKGRNEFRASLLPPAPMSPRKRPRDESYANEREVHAAHIIENSGGGAVYLAIRPPPRRLRSLRETTLRVVGQGIARMIVVPPRPSGTGSFAVGWDVKAREEEAESRCEVLELGDCIARLPSVVANRLLEMVLSSDDTGLGGLALAGLFFNPNLTTVSLALSIPSNILARLTRCTEMTSLSLVALTNLTDAALRPVLLELKLLTFVNLRGCTKISDASIIALSRACEGRLRDVNLSITGVSIKGITSLLARCGMIRSLKLANVEGLVRCTQCDTAHSVHRTTRE